MNKGLAQKLMKNMKKDSGVAGTNVLLGLIIALFIIGLVVMVFVLTGGELEGATTDVEAIQAINDTGNAILGVTDWFDIFIVIGAIVVLVLLLVIVIGALKSAQGQASTG